LGSTRVVVGLGFLICAQNAQALKKNALTMKEIWWRCPGFGTGSIVFVQLPLGTLSDDTKAGLVKLILVLNLPVIVDSLSLYAFLKNDCRRCCKQVGP